MKSFTKHNQAQKLEDWTVYQKSRSGHTVPRPGDVAKRDNKVELVNRKFYLSIMGMLTLAGIDSRLHQCKTGNVILLVNVGSIEYSVCRFYSTGKFKIFYPFASAFPTKVNCESWMDVAYFFTEKL